MQLHHQHLCLIPLPLSHPMLQHLDPSGLNAYIHQLMGAFESAAGAAQQGAGADDNDEDAGADGEGAQHAQQVWALEQLYAAARHGAASREAKLDVLKFLAGQAFFLPRGTQAAGEGEGAGVAAGGSTLRALCAARLITLAEATANPATAVRAVQQKPAVPAVPAGDVLLEVVAHIDSLRAAGRLGTGGDDATLSALRTLRSSLRAHAVKAAAAGAGSEKGGQVGQKLAALQRLACLLELYVLQDSELAGAEVVSDLSEAVTAFLREEGGLSGREKAGRAEAPGGLGGGGRGCARGKGADTKGRVTKRRVFLCGLKRRGMWDATGDVMTIARAPYSPSLPPLICPADAAGPHWMDTLVDVLLSLVASSQGSALPSAPLRDSVEGVFRAFCQNLTATGEAACRVVFLEGGWGKAVEDRHGVRL
jgi:hypothetical protein